MRTLAAGFVELATAAAAPPPAPKEEPKPEPPPAAKPAAPVVPTVYTAEEPGIVPPITVRQDMPTVPVAIAQMTKSQGLLDLVIDEQGPPGFDRPSHQLASDLRQDDRQRRAGLEVSSRPRLTATPVQFRKLVQVSVAKR